MERYKMNLSHRDRSNAMMKQLWKQVLLSAGALAFCFGLALAQESTDDEQPTGTVVRTESGGKVVINSKSVTYNFTQRIAIFEKEVSCTDGAILINCEKLSVFLTDQNSVRKVEAEGEVAIRELGTAKKATAGKAVYDVSEDTVVLTDNPRLEERDQGFFTKGAERIVYFRKEQEFKAEGENMQIEFGIPSDKSGRASDLFGPRNDPKQE